MSAYGGARRVVSVRAWSCPVPMRYPVRLGAIEYIAREYAVLELRTDDGLEGRALGYTRGTPVIPAIAALATALGALDCSDPPTVQDRLSRRFLPGWQQLLRAASLIDIALWDIAARAGGVPLHRLLGASGAEAPLMAVTGYFSDRRSAEEIIEEAQSLTAEGVAGTKLILGGHDPEADGRLAAGMREALGSEATIGIDFHAPWRKVEEAVAHCRRLLPYDPRFVEDPFPSTAWRQLEQLAARLPEIAFAAGEDATASGGITAFLDAARLAEERGAIVAPHIFAYVHAPLCAALDVVANAEFVAAATGADPWDRLLARPWPLRDGAWRLAEEPGIDLPLDMERVAALARETLELKLDSA
jgi:L-alanine-DL-glutamate epimerase-like enolase superfamily enzyme